MNKAADYVSANQVRKRLYSPDIVDNTIRLMSNKQALSKAGNTDFNLEELLNTALESRRE